MINEPKKVELTQDELQEATDIAESISRQFETDRHTVRRGPWINYRYPDNGCTVVPDWAFRWVDFGEGSDNSCIGRQYYCTLHFKDRNGNELGSLVLDGVNEARCGIDYCRI